MIQDLNNKGYAILRKLVSPTELEYYRGLADEALMETTSGVAMHAILKTPNLLNFLDYLKRKGVLYVLEKDYFKSKFILNSFSALDNNVLEPNFSALVHRDIRFFSGNCNLMVNCLVMLDDFTEENGATWVLPESHLEEEFPLGAYWDKNAIQLTGKAGDMVFWNSNLLHKTGENTTGKARRALPIVFSKSAMKQLLDYPKALGELGEGIEPYLTQLLGYDSRVPASLQEWNGERTYKKDQD